ncbi:TonB-dependent receptor [Caulobacter sp.]|uniref:TonB-dependent receptor domain-containing protein n=1 Tax=Caulobacter sp. TaxID=78 RepID=UPI0031DECAA4
MTRTHSKTALLLATALGAGLIGLQAQAQEAENTAVEEIVVTGYREALASALNQKRLSNAAIDVINAEDIADFPDANLAESIQRLPGITIDRENGEGRQITVRGLGGDFTRVRINGLEALSTAGDSYAQSTGNRSRGFDFNTFASELFSQIAVRKSASADVDEGSLGATVDLTAGKPLNYKENRLALSLQDGYYENGNQHNPRVAGLATRRFDTKIGEFGVLFSGAYNKRRQRADGYAQQPGSADYVYRGATFPTLTTLTNGQNRQGFSAPTGTPCDQIVPGANITNAAVCAALSGSNPGAYNLINNPIGSTVTNGVTTAPGSTKRFTALPMIQSREVVEERRGFTGSLQWKPTSRTSISVDGLYSKLESQSTNYQLTPFGLVRGDLVNGLYQVSAATPVATKRGFYNRCDARAGTDILAPIDCGQSMNSATPLPGAISGMSFNPNNWDPYDYYNSPTSRGYIPDAAGIARRVSFIGKQAVRVIDGQLTPGGTAEYLKLGNVDISSVTDQNSYQTTFKQGSISLDHDFGNGFYVSALYGRSESNNHSTGLLAEIEHLDAGQGTNPSDYFIYDYREGGAMPILNVGFNAADPNNWEYIKGHSSIRNFQRIIKNTYEGGRIDLTWEIHPDYKIKAGFTRRTYTFSNQQFQRTLNDTLNPSFLEAGVTMQEMTRLTNWGEGLKAPAGSTTSYLSPDLEAFKKTYDFTCNCINKWGDWRITYLNNAANQFGVREVDTGGYGMLDFKRDLFGGTVRGDVGLRYAKTEVVATGLTNTSRPVSNSNEYTDWLPSLNVVFEPTSNLLFRFAAAEVMARPILNNLAPSVTSFSAPSAPGAVTGGSITLGNTKLKPFRATNYDFSAEWYFGRGGLLALAVFRKELSSYPQTVVAEARLSQILTPEIIQSLRASQTNVESINYINADNVFNVRQYRDAPGGTIDGVEVSYQQNFTFLPETFSFLPEWTKNFGIQANYTHIKSELNYILDPGALATATAAARPAVIAKGPFLGASPDSLNFTLFYEAPTWSIRGSVAHRAAYYTNYPVSAGSCDPGFCDGPLVNDFLGSKATTNFDMAARYNINERVSLTIDALNLTNQKSERYAYPNDPMPTGYIATGRQIFMGARITF